MLPLVVALNVAGTVVIEDRTEVRGRVVNSPRIDPATKLPRVDPTTQGPLPNDNKSALVMDVETDPRASFRVDNAKDALTLTYAPRVVVANFGNAGAAQNGETTLDLIHRPMLTGELQIDPRNRFVVNGLLQFGTTTAGTLLLPERWDGEQRPNVPRAFPVLPFNKQTFLSIYAAAGIAHQFSPRFSATLSAFYITFGQPTQRGRIEAGGTTYLQNPGVNLELEYKASQTDAFIFNVAPQVNIVQASPVEVNQDGQEIGADGRLLVLPNTDTADNLYDQLDRQAVGRRFVNRTAPNTYQVLLEARWHKDLERTTYLELAAGGNLLQQSVPRAAIRRFTLGQFDVPPSVADDAISRLQPGQAGPVQDERVVDDPFKLIARNPGQSRSSKNFFNLLPVGEVLISHGFATSSAKGRLIAFNRADAWLNTVSGEIGARNTLVAALNFDFGLDALRAQAAFVKSLPLSEKTTEFTQVITEVAYQRELTRSWFFDIGARVGFQDAVTFKNPVNEALSLRSQFFQPGAFVGIAWRPLPAKF